MTDFYAVIPFFIIEAFGMIPVCKNHSKLLIFGVLECF